jgi:hypothetical protein
MAAHTVWHRVALFSSSPQEQRTDFFFIDATVCHNRRIRNHRVFDVRRHAA